MRSCCAGVGERVRGRAGRGSAARRPAPLRCPSLAVQRCMEGGRAGRRPAVPNFAASAMQNGFQGQGSNEGWDGEPAEGAGATPAPLAHCSSLAELVASVGWVWSLGAAQQTGCPPVSLTSAVAATASAHCAPPHQTSLCQFPPAAPSGPCPRARLPRPAAACGNEGGEQGSGGNDACVPG